MEQVHLAAELAVVALLRFLDLLEIGLELLLLGEGGAVDAAEHLAVGIATPIGARDLHQLEGAADLAGRGHVRAAAEVEPVALFVDLDLLVVRDGIDQFDLEQLALVAKDALGLLARPHFLGEGFVTRDDLAHLLLDRVEVLGGERLVAEEVVVEAVLDHRADGDLGARPQRLDGFRKHMRGVVPNELQRARVLARKKFDPSVALDRVIEVGERAVERHRDRTLDERGRDALGDVEAGGAVREVPTRAVGKGQRDHHVAPVAHSLPTNAGKRGLEPRGRLRARRTGSLEHESSRCNHAVDRLRLPASAAAPEAPGPSSVRGRREVDGAIGPAPAAVAPGEEPARVMGQGWRHEIEPGRAKRMTAAEPGQRHPAARP